MNWNRLKKRHVIGAIITLGLSIGGASLAYAPAATAIVCEIVECEE